MNSYLRVCIAIPSIIFLLSNALSQNNKTELSGYQEFKWGMSRMDVESVLRKNNVLIKSSTKKEITVNAMIELEEYPCSVNVKKSFVFSNNSLYLVVLECLSSSNNHYRADSIFSQFLRQLKNKYGNPDSDTSSGDDYMLFRTAHWKFTKGYIMMESSISSASLGESDIRLKLFLERIMDGVNIYYGKNASNKDIQERKKRISKEF